MRTISLYRSFYRLLLLRTSKSAEQYRVSKQELHRRRKRLEQLRTSLRILKHSVMQGAFGDFKPDLLIIVLMPQ